MSSTCIGMVTYGNIQFTKLVVERLKETVKSPYKLVIVVGKPDDKETIQYVTDNEIASIVHPINKGFPVSLNDIYDWAWKYNNYDNLIIIGNDVLPYPYAVDSLIEVANSSNYEWVCSREYSVKNLISEFPETQIYFQGPNCIFTEFSMKPWDVMTNYSPEISLSDAGLSDVHNLCLFKKSVFEKIGYIDVNFYPAYFEDNDYCIRAIKAGIVSCTVLNSKYFHFWSRTIHQGNGGSTDNQFSRNSCFYNTKWGKNYELPFNGKEYELFYSCFLRPEINIQSREQETMIINYWRNL